MIYTYKSMFLRQTFMQHTHLYRIQRPVVLALVFLILLGIFGTVSTATAQADCPQVDLAAGQISRCVYADQLRAMWLGEAIANWTGLTTEAVRQDAPFYTDDDWGRDQNLDWKTKDVIDFDIQDPWGADDDTDIEYVYLHLMDQAGAPLLTAEQIADGWRAHINDWIWVSNRRARDLMEFGALPPVTSMGAANPDYLQIDAQLTTEIFGAIAPGMPAQALELSQLPITTTAGGYAAHAAQFFVLLYALAPQVDRTLPRAEQVVWLVEQARQYIPDTSKTADIADFVLADFLANPNKDDWESTRDRVYQRYHANAAENGFRYQDWTESSVNFASGLIALLYGEGDFRRTVQIGTLTGWDSDNGTATMGGLLGLLYGTDELVAAFPDETLSDRYHSHRTRDTMPDYLRDDRRAEDTFTLMAERMLPLIEQTIIQAGGGVDGDVWTLPAPSAEPPLALNPLLRITEQSANHQILAAGGEIQVSVEGEVAASRMSGIADGFEHDFSGRERPRRIPAAYQRMIVEGELVVTVVYDRAIDAHTIRLIEGDVGGDALRAEALVGETWIPLEDVQLSATPDPAVPYQIFDFVLPEPVALSGIRVTINAAGRLPEISVVELDAFFDGPLPAAP
ncbi:MAG: ADP-ribosylglycohydrolase family protein [Chloroflexi bacterium]|nr:ADP-ribosylglycohydrolase family protein [Chloroflexota bacterium]